MTRGAKRENIFGEEESNNFERERNGKGQNVADLREDTFGDTIVNGFILFLEFRMKGQ